MELFFLEMSIMMFSGSMFVIMFILLRSMGINSLDIFIFSFIACIILFIFSFHIKPIVIALNGILIFMEKGIRFMFYENGETQ